MGICCGRTRAQANEVDWKEVRRGFTRDGQIFGVVVCFMVRIMHTLDGRIAMRSTIPGLMADALPVRIL